MERTPGRFGEAALAVIYFLRTRGFGATSHHIHGRDQEPYGVGSYYMTQWFGRHLDSLLLLLRQAAEVISASGERRNAVRSTQPNALARPSATPSRAIQPFGGQIIQRVCQPLVSARFSITALELPVVSPLPPSAREPTVSTVSLSLVVDVRLPRPATACQYGGGPSHQSSPFRGGGGARRENLLRELPQFMADHVLRDCYRVVHLAVVDLKVHAHEAGEDGGGAGLRADGGRVFAGLGLDEGEAGACWLVISSIAALHHRGEGAIAGSWKAEREAGHGVLCLDVRDDVWPWEGLASVLERARMHKDEGGSLGKLTFPDRPLE